MKKLVLFFAVLVAVSVASCKKSDATSTETVDSTAMTVDTTTATVDTTVVDTTAAAPVQ